jgi:cAMP-dependent protein kinase regulator
MEDYLEQHNISAILKGLVMRLCVQKPEYPIEYMIHYLQDNYLNKEVSGRMGTMNLKRESIVEYDDRVDVMDERAIIEPDSLKRKRRGAICCEPPKADDSMRSFIPKDKYTQLHLENALRKNIMFSYLEDDQRREVFGAMFEVRFKAGDTIIRQGNQLMLYREFQLMT